MFIVIIPVLIIAIIVIFKNRKRLKLKFNKFIYEYKLLMIIEVLFLLAMLILNITNKTVVVKQKDPHTRKILQSSKVKEGQEYRYEAFRDWKTLEIEKKSFTIENVNMDSVTINKNDQEIEYKYGRGFSYYGAKSCNCGTPIIFENPYSSLLKIIILCMVMIDIIIICFMKIEKEGDK